MTSFILSCFHNSHHDVTMSVLRNAIASINNFSCKKAQDTYLKLEPSKTIDSPFLPADGTLVWGGSSDASPHTGQHPQESLMTFPSHSSGTTRGHVRMSHGGQYDDTSPRLADRTRCDRLAEQVSIKYNQTSSNPNFVGFIVSPSLQYTAVITWYRRVFHRIPQI